MRDVNASMPDEAISQMLAERITAGDFPSAVYVVAEAGRVVLSDAIGDAVREPVRHPATLDTIYDLASLTKPLVTGLLSAQLVERGVLELDHVVAQYLPEFEREDKRRITIRQLLTHTSGLPAWHPLYITTGGRREKVLATIASQTLEAEPGTNVVYSDLGFITLGLVVETVTQTKLANLARREIFEPLQLEQTFFNPRRAMQTSIAACESGGNAYEREVCRNQETVSKDGSNKGNSDEERLDTVESGEAHANAPTIWREQLIWGEVHDGNAYFLGGEAGHAGLFSNAHETLRIARQFLSGSTRLIRPETCAMFRTNMTETLNEARSFGWQLAATKDSTAGASLPPDSFGHLGFTGTSCWIDPTRERIFILLTNRTHARPLPFVNINSTRRSFHTLAVAALESLHQGAD